MEIKKWASVMTGAKGGVATKLREEFSKSIINIHCICQRLALACADTGADLGKKLRGGGGGGGLYEGLPQ